MSHTSLPKRGLALVIVMVLAGVVGAVATAADPDAGRISLDDPMTGWNGESFIAGASVSSSLCRPGSPACDEFTLTADIPKSHWDTHKGGAVVNIAWEDDADDFDLRVYDAAGKSVATSTQAGTTGESTIIPEASGTYRVVVQPYTVTDSDYKGGVVLESRAIVGEGGGGVPTEPVSSVKCENGNAGGFPCDKVDLAAFMPRDTIGGGELNDIWGWTDPQTGSEYALVGKTSGTSFVDVTDPEAPVYLGDLPSAQPVETLFNVWRDVKVYKDHAYVVSEEPTHGMQVFDLTRLRGKTEAQTWDADAMYRGFGNAHNIAINEDSGFAYAIGTTTCQGGPHIVDIRNPQQPLPAGCVPQDGYTHDTQCVNYDGPDADYKGRELCLSSNEDSLTIVDVTDKLQPKQVSKVPYQGSEYTHQGWLTEDGKYFLVGDELDEQQLDVPTTTLVFDVTDLDAPKLVKKHLAETAAIDHNLYIKGDHVFQSNYRAGLRILDAGEITDGGKLTEIGFFDVYPADDRAEFNGTWSNYPYFESGTVIASGIEQGLFVLQPHATRPDGGDGGGGSDTGLTKAECKKGGWQDATRADGSGFENQGDCMEFANTGK